MTAWFEEAFREKVMNEMWRNIGEALASRIPHVAISDLVLLAPKLWKEEANLREHLKHPDLTENGLKLYSEKLLRCYLDMIAVAEKRTAEKVAAGYKIPAPWPVLYRIRNKSGGTDPDLAWVVFEGGRFEILSRLLEETGICLEEVDQYISRRQQNLPSEAHTPAPGMPPKLGWKSKVVAETANEITLSLDHELTLQSEKIPESSSPSVQSLGSKNEILVEDLPLDLEIFESIE